MAAVAMGLMCPVHSRQLLCTAGNILAIGRHYLFTHLHRW